MTIKHSDIATFVCKFQRRDLFFSAKDYWKHWLSVMLQRARYDKKYPPHKFNVNDYKRYKKHLESNAK